MRNIKEALIVLFIPIVISIAVLIMAVNSWGGDISAEDIGRYAFFGSVYRFRDGNTVCYIAHQIGGDADSINCVRTK